MQALVIARSLTGWCPESLPTTRFDECYEEFLDQECKYHPSLALVEWWAVVAGKPLPEFLIKQRKDELLGFEVWHADREMNEAEQARRDISILPQPKETLMAALKKEMHELCGNSGTLARSKRSSVTYARTIIRLSMPSRPHTNSAERRPISWWADNSFYNIAAPYSP